MDRIFHLTLNQYSLKDYFLMPLNENEFDEFMKNKNFLGLNVTIPYKEKVLKYIIFIIK